MIPDLDVSDLEDNRNDSSEESTRRRQNVLSMIRLRIRWIRYRIDQIRRSRRG